VTQAPVTLRHLLRLEELRECAITGTREGSLDRAVRDVVVVAQRGGQAAIPGDALVVAPYRKDAGYETELLLRRAEMSRAAGVVLTGASRLMLSTHRLSERIGMPLLTVPGGDPVDLAWRLCREVHDPEGLAVQLLPRVLRRLRTPLTRPDGLIAILDRELGGASAVLSSDGAVVAGQTPGEFPSSVLDRPVPQQVDLEDCQWLCVPVFVDDVRRPGLWLVTRLPVAHPSWTASALHALTAAALALAGWMARQRLTGERDARDRSTLLAELLDTAPAIPGHVAERAVRAGWRLDGWHVGVLIRVAADTAAIVRLTGRVSDALGDNGLRGPLVERADGWSFWTTEDREPPSASHREVTNRVRAALDSIARDADAVAGVGRPYPGPGGIAATLREAREACLFAGTGHRVEHVDELGVRRVLADWYHAEAFRSYARTLLSPLLQAGEDQLMETLSTYLERESSASSTAAALGVHRNTVAYRISRIERLLSMNLARADERLVLQLACRAVQGGDDGSADHPAAKG
jgi:PucR family transcriptional regulator, purine catabolism regulatory protein